MYQQALDLFETSWSAPDSFPNITEGLVAIDLETRDEGIRKGIGAGWAFRDHGYVIGIAVATEEKSWYFPIAHENGANLNKLAVLGWLGELCENTAVSKVFHNSLYDLGWLQREGILVRGKIYDTMVAAPLLDENRYSYSLNKLGWDYVGEHKSEGLLEDVAKAWKIDPKADMWKLPAKYVGDYAEQDTKLTLRLWKILEQEIKNNDLQNIFDLEMRVIPVLQQARWRGVRIDEERAFKTKKIFTEKYTGILDELTKENMGKVEIWSNDSIAKAFEKQNLKFPRTQKGSPSFEADWLEEHPHWLPQKIAEARKYEKAANTFIQKMIIDHTINGRIHCEMHPLKSDEGGTVSGRLSCTNPNLQQVPARQPEIAQAIRSLFLPEEGSLWDCKDYSQQEPRLTVHYAHKLKLEGAEAAVEYYRNDPGADFHQIVADMTGLPRKQAKIINLGLSYNMGVLKLCKSLGLPIDRGSDGREVAGAEAVQMFAKYHSRVPFVGKLNKYAMQIAEKRGYIKTLEGRHCRFNKWEPVFFEKGEERGFADSEASALKKFPGRKVKRAFLHKAMNRLIQSSAADQTKRAMVALYEEGATIMLQIHDELCLSSYAAVDSLKHQRIMEEVCPLEVPSKVDSELGINWGEAKYSIQDVKF